MTNKNSHNGIVTVRQAHALDAPELERLAALDSGAVPGLPALIAERDYRVIAALPLAAGRPVADPFEPSAELVDLLRLRAEQLNRETTTRPGARDRLRALLRRPANA